MPDPQRPNGHRATLPPPREWSCDGNRAAKAAVRAARCLPTNSEMRSWLRRTLAIVFRNSKYYADRALESQWDSANLAAQGHATSTPEWIPPFVAEKRRAARRRPKSPSNTVEWNIPKR